MTQRLNLATGRLRLVCHPQPLPLRKMAIAGAAPFAARLLARFQERSAFWTRLGVVFANRPVHAEASPYVTSLNVRSSGHQFHIRPRLQLTFVRTAPLFQRPSAVEPREATAVYPAAVPALVTTVVNRPTRLVRQTEWAERHTVARLREREVRTSLLADRPGASWVPNGNNRHDTVPQRASAVPRVVRQATVATTVTPKAPPPERLPGTAKSLSPAVTERPAPAALSSQEVDRVTDHVLRTIERQIQARRERTGRV